MARPLAVVAVSGIAISAISLSLAALISPRGETWSPFYNYENRYGWGRESHIPFAESGERISREFTWDGSSHADITVPGVVTYEPGTQQRVTVRGRQSTVDHLRIENGRIYFDAPLIGSRSTSLEVHIQAPSIDSFSLNGGGKLILQHIEQSELAINLRGSGLVEGKGKVESLSINIFGSANAELANLSTANVEVNVFGSGNADVTPNGDAEIRIFGSGDVRFHAKPRNVSTRSFGSGRVIQLEGATVETPVRTTLSESESDFSI